MNRPLDPLENPDGFPVAVLMTRQPAPADKPWRGDAWRVIGVMVTSTLGPGRTRVRSGPEGEDYLWGGLRLRLYKDEAESYYHNLMSTNPCVFVITNTDAGAAPRPLLVSASFDEAHAYLEAEGEAEAVPMPAELYNWVERFVLAHYIPERKVKRKRRDWAEDNDVQRR
jgi:hypothetical protein